MVGTRDGGGGVRFGSCGRCASNAKTGIVLGYSLRDFLDFVNHDVCDRDVLNKYKIYIYLVLLKW